MTATLTRWTVLATSTPNAGDRVSVRARHGARVATLDLPATTALTDDLFDQAMSFALDLHRSKNRNPRRTTP